jgi:hypothetical protein
VRSAQSFRERPGNSEVEKPLEQAGMSGTSRAAPGASGIVPVAGTRGGSRAEEKMALLRRELHRQCEGPEVTRKELWALVFDTDTKRLYVEHEWAELETRQGEAEGRTSAMDIAEYLTQGGHTAGHRELWRLLQSLFVPTDDSDDHARI